MACPVPKLRYNNSLDSLSSDEPLVFHVITSGGDIKISDLIGKDAYLVPLKYRGPGLRWTNQHQTLISPDDILAGDDKYLFFSIYRPIESGSATFVFTLKSLYSFATISFRLFDLIEIYSEIMKERGDTISKLKLVAKYGTVTPSRKLLIDAVNGDGLAKAQLISHIIDLYIYLESSNLKTSKEYMTIIEDQLMNASEILADQAIPIRCSVAYREDVKYAESKQFVIRKGEEWQHGALEGIESTYKGRIVVPSFGKW